MSHSALIAAGSAAGVVAAAVVWRAAVGVRRRGSAPVPPSLRGLKPHYRRLGTSSPDAPCPCGRGGSYAACCRARDVSRLESDVIAYLLHRWERRSYLGRRSNYTMGGRLADHPLPPAVLPDWVTNPQNHSFPIADQQLLSWFPGPPPDVHDEQAGPPALLL